MDIETPKTTMPQPKKKPNLTKWLTAVLVLVLLGANGVTAWQFMRYKNQNAAFSKKTSSLQGELDNLNKQLTAAKKAKDKAAAAPVIPACNSTVTASLKENIEAAINTMNTAALEGYMAPSVTVVFAASEKGGAESPSAAVADLNILTPAVQPWNFNLPAATLNQYKAGFYKQYFAEGMFIGKSTNKYVISFGFTCGKISSIFVAPSEDLLL